MLAMLRETENLSIPEEVQQDLVHPFLKGRTPFFTRALVTKNRYFSSTTTTLRVREADR